MKHLPCSLLLCMGLLVGCNSKSSVTENDFVTVHEGQFILHQKPYYFIGANLWYGAILGSEGEGGNRLRLQAELDSLCSIGATNLRVLVGADGKRGVFAKVEPTLQEAPGVYNDTLFAGLDYLLMEMGKRSMKAVLYLNNSWEWSGGYAQYVSWATGEQAPDPVTDGWSKHVAFARRFHQLPKAKVLFANYVKDVISRTNRYTGIKYTDETAIFAWQIGNEPRAFSEENKPAFADWLAEVARQIHTLDPHHLVSVGSEGKYGCEVDMQFYESIHANPDIDYLTFHIWPYNWQWVSKETVCDSVQSAIAHTQNYLDEHLIVAARLNKPAVLEEFGYPRDGFCFTKGSPTIGRDTYYRFVLQYLVDSYRSNGRLAGVNFWAWGGLARTSNSHVYWQKGDDYTGDPAQEEQGLNSLFWGDSTLEIIRGMSQEFR